MRENPGTTPILLAAACALLLVNCHPAERVVTPIDNPSLPARGFFMGLLPMPGSGQSFDSVYRQAARYSEFVPVWGKPSAFFDLAADLQGSWGNSFVRSYTRGNGMFPIVHLSFMGEGMALAAPPGMTGATLSTPAWRTAYRQAALDVVRAAKPRYLSLGNEVNRWYEKYGVADTNPNGFQNFVSLYQEAYDSVKQLSPETKVFCTFAREIVDENREADLGVLSRFNPDKLDLLVFTSYPFSVQGVHRPDSMPDDYYSRALTIMPGKPFGLIEIGWTDLDFFGGEQGQADFLTQAAGRLTRDQGVTLSLLGWVWLHDLDTSDHVGLIHSDGTEKQAYRVWKTLSGR